MNLSVAALGIDIAKAKFDVCLVKPSGRAPNTRLRVSEILCKLVQFCQLNSVFKHNRKLIHG